MTAVRTYRAAGLVTDSETDIGTKWDEKSSLKRQTFRDGGIRVSKNIPRTPVRRDEPRKERKKKGESRDKKNVKKSARGSLRAVAPSHVH